MWPSTQLWCMPKETHMPNFSKIGASLPPPPPLPPPKILCSLWCVPLVGYIMVLSSYPVVGVLIATSCDHHYVFILDIVLLSYIVLYINSWLIPLLGICTLSQIARFMGSTRGPSGADKTQMGHMLAPWTLLSEILSQPSNKNRNTQPLCRVRSWNIVICYICLLHSYFIQHCNV